MGEGVEMSRQSGEASGQEKNKQKFAEADLQHVRYPCRAPRRRAIKRSKPFKEMPPALKRACGNSLRPAPKMEIHIFYVEEGKSSSH